MDSLGILWKATGSPVQPAVTQDRLCSRLAFHSLIVGSNVTPPIPVQQLVVHVLVPVVHYLEMRFLPWGSSLAGQDQTCTQRVRPRLWWLRELEQSWDMGTAQSWAPAALQEPWGSAGTNPRAGPSRGWAAPCPGAGGRGGDVPAQTHTWLPLLCSALLPFLCSAPTMISSVELRAHSPSRGRVGFPPLWCPRAAAQGFQQIPFPAAQPQARLLLGRPHRFPVFTENWAAEILGMTQLLLTCPSPHWDSCPLPKIVFMAHPGCPCSCPALAGVQAWPWFCLLRILGLKLSLRKEHSSLPTRFVFREDKKSPLETGPCKSKIIEMMLFIYHQKGMRL